MTYLILTIVVLALLAIATIPTLRRLPIKPIVATLAVLVVLTWIFDNVIVGLGLVDYDPDKILGIRLPWMPVEDFSYTLGAVLLIPAVWWWLRPRDKGTKK